MKNLQAFAIVCAFFASISFACPKRAVCEANEPAYDAATIKVADLQFNLPLEKVNCKLADQRKCGAGGAYPERFPYSRLVQVDGKPIGPFAGNCDTKNLIKFPLVSPSVTGYGYLGKANSPFPWNGTNNRGNEFIQDDTITLTSSVLKYRQENGRRYHAYREGQYWGPNDDKQNEALDIAHHLFLKALDGKLFLAPIGENAEKILDVGTGTGIWVMDVADQYPSVEVVGNDLSPIQPRSVPPNARFEVDDCCINWIYAEKSFDLVHVRMLLGSVADWPGFYQQAIKHLKPGGYIEHLELSVIFRCDDDSFAKDDAYSRWGPLFVEAGQEIGRPLEIVDDISRLVEEAGFVDVVEVRQKLPVGSWSSDQKYKEIGAFNQLHCEESLEGWAMALLTRELGWSYNEVQVFLVEMRRDIRNRKKHGYLEMVVVYARKPTEGEI
ncbi:MAG: hypothetical protein M1833_002306 [Piccolia ochrophora]|nr:MAG: hypothetical protein M1833_002306 [Piccolia ochrophora]